MEYFASPKKTIAAALLALAAIAFSLPAVADGAANHLYLATNIKKPLTVSCSNGSTYKLGSHFAGNSDIFDTRLTNAVQTASYTAPNVVGYEFKGWYRADENHTPQIGTPTYHTSFPTAEANYSNCIQEARTFVPANSYLFTACKYESGGVFFGFTALYMAKYEAVTYTVSFANPSTESWTQPKSQTATGGAKITLPSLSLESGVSFLGWYSDSTFKTKVGNAGASYQPTKSCTLYAKLVRDQYTVVFDKNAADATGTMSDQSLPCGKNANLTKNAFTRKDYAFIGWSKSPTASSVSYVDAESVNLTTAKDDKITLYAVWEPTTAVVIFNAKGGTFEGGNEIGVTQTYDTAYCLPEEDPTYVGYDFVGWETASGTPIDSQSVFTKRSEKILYAKWKVKTFNIVTTAVNCKITAPKEGTFGREVSFTWAGDTLPGYDIVYTPPALFTVDDPIIGEVPLSVTAGDRDAYYTMSDRYYPEVRVTVTFTKTAKTYTVKFDSVGGTKLDEKTVTYDSTFGTLPIPTRDGYTFAGWWTEKVGGEEVKGEDTVKILSGITLYARWTYTIAFAKGDGSAVGEMTPLTATWDAPVALPPNAFTLTGNRFAGWLINGRKDPIVDQAEVENLTVVDGEALLTAKWVPIAYTISFDANWDPTRLGTMTNEAPAAVMKHYGAALPLEEWGPDNTLAPFLGWGITPTGDVLVADGGTLESDLSDGDPVTLYAIWDLPDMKLSDAVGCRNLPLESKRNYQTRLGTAEAWQVGEKGIVSGNVTANNYPAQTQSNHSSNLELYLSGPGKLTFTWALRTAGAGRGTYFIQDVGTQAIRESGEATAIGETVTYENGEDDYVRITWQGYGVFTNAGEECPGNLVITSMTWIPAGFEPVHPEPTEKDRPVISADYSFETSSDFDYVIWKKDDLTAAEWTKLKTVTGNGESVALPMFDGAQGFFKVEVIQRGSK